MQRTLINNNISKHIYIAITTARACDNHASIILGKHNI